MRPMKQTVLCVLFGLLPLQGVAVAEGGPSVEEVRAWLVRAHADAATLELPRNVVIEVQIATKNSATPAQLVAWKREVEGKPWHPLRRQIQDAERRLRDGPDISRNTLWYASPDVWRLNVDTESAETTFFDTARRKDVLWQLYPDRVSVMSARNAGPVPDNVRSLVDDMLQLLRTGGLNEAQSADPSDAEVSGLETGEWTALLSGEDGRWWKFRGAWRPGADGSTARGEILAFSSGSGIGREPSVTMTFDEAEFDAALGMFIPRNANRIIRGAADLNVDQTISIAPVRSVEPDYMRELVRVPEHGGTDVVRGGVEIEMATDHRKGERHMYAAGENEDQVSTMWNDPSRKAERRSRRAWKLLGWSTAGVLMAAFVVLRIVRRR